MLRFTQSLRPSSYVQGLIQGVDEVTSHVTHHEFYSFIIFHQSYFQNQSQLGMQTFNISWRMSQTPLQEHTEYDTHTM